MDFLLEPLELGTDLDDLLKTHIEIVCSGGYACTTGTIKPTQ